MTADEARKLVADSKQDSAAQTDAWARNWFRAIDKAAREGRTKCLESELPALRMPITQGAKVAAFDQLRLAGFEVRTVQTGPSEFDTEVSW